MNRRAFLISAAAVTAAPNPKLRIGVMDGVVGKRSDPAAVGVARRLGLEGLQVTLGAAAAGQPLPLSDAALQARFLAESRAHGVPLVSTYIDILHTHCLKSDPEALRRAVEGVEITRKLGAKILMLVFFGKCALNSRVEMDAVVGPLKELAPHAEKAGVVLGFENVIPAAENLRILDQVGSRALQVFYDIGNATNLGGWVPAEEIRAMGRQRICQFHFKDKGYLGEGAVDVEAALAAIGEIGYEGQIVLETGAPSKDIEADLKRNVAYLRGLL
ncbi:MAG TPA: sugar phosphate isomerase/epimerase [Paludibaculum sp.]|jgi:sugar phosphate isomerase/epimerase